MNVWICNLCGRMNAVFRHWRCQHCDQKDLRTYSNDPHS